MWGYGPRMDEDDTQVFSLCLKPLLRNGDEIPCIVGHKHASLAGGRHELIRVIQTPGPSIVWFLDGVCIVAEAPQLASDLSWNHFVEPEAHR